MTTTQDFKDLIDLPCWRPVASTPNAHAAGGGVVCDLRTDGSRGVRMWQLASATILNDYNCCNDGWSLNLSPALGGTFGAGAGIVFKPCRGPRGTIAAGSSTTMIKLTTPLHATVTVGVGQLANRGNGRGYKIRVIGNSAGGSGKVEERTIISNSGGTTTPDIYLDSALSFTPAAGDTYEILSGRVYVLSAGTMAASTWKAFDVAVGAMVPNLSITNLPATVSTDTAFCALDEQYCPNTPGEGFLLGNGDGGIASKALVATASSSTSLTGQATNGDAGVAANEYRNFQIRIVKDTAIPTAVGQRRKITSHTIGASPVYTVPAWTVTPSPDCQYVVEHANEILCWTTAVATTYTYAEDAIGAAAADTWSTSTYAASGSAMAAGCMAFTPFANTLDAAKLNRYSNVFRFRGGSVSLDLLDIAAASTGSWSNAIAYGGGVSVSTGSCGEYDPVGGFFYYNVGNTNAIVRFDPIHRYVENWAQLRWAQGTAAVGHRMSCSRFIDSDDGTKVAMVYLVGCAQTNIFQCLVSR